MRQKNPDVDPRLSERCLGLIEEAESEIFRIRNEFARACLWKQQQGNVRRAMAASTARASPPS
jgi:hypothetical protein